MNRLLRLLAVTASIPLVLFAGSVSAAPLESEPPATDSANVVALLADREGGALPGQATSERRAPAIVELPNTWTVGEHLRLEVLTEQEDYRGATRVRGGGLRTAVDVMVVEELEDGYVVRWTWGPASLVDGSSPELRLAAALANLTAGLDVDLLTDEYGMPIAVLNLEEIAAANREAVALLGQSLKAEGMPEAQVAQVLQFVEAALSESSIESAALKEPQLFHFASGGSFAQDVKQEYEDLLANLFGGEPFPSRAWFELTEIDRAAGTATIEWRQMIDEQRAGEIVLATLRALAARSGMPLPETNGPAPLAIDDAATFVMDTQTGWPRSVQHERIVVAGDQRRIERTTFQTIEVTRVG
ncbi:MAG: hypothetical protein HY332_25510 [Chloroflexi bacterium]|nr:hypothetical protein [Chloroflexota bacterium]